MIDLHNHLIPGVDDGATGPAEARAALASMQREGIRAVIATPHLRGALTRQPEVLAARLAELDEGWERLRSLAAEEFPEVRVERGTELMLDVPAPCLADPRVRLAGTRFVLVEFAAMAVPPRSGAAVAELRAGGWTPVIAHPERYGELDRDLAVVEEWRRAGALLQVNTGSLLGRYGARARSVAWALLESGRTDYLSSDYHARGRPAIREGRRVLEEAGGEEQALLLMEVNPERLLSGLAPEPVPPLAKRDSLWRRLLRKDR